MSTILVQSQVFSQKMKRVLVPTAAALLLSACGANFFQNEVTESLKKESYANSEFYVNKAEKSADTETQQSYQLLAVRKLLDENKIVEAQNMMSNIRVDKLNETQRVEYQLLNAQLAAFQGNDTQASSLLRALVLANLSQAQLLRVYQTEAQLAHNQRDVIGVVRARVQMDRYMTDNKSRQENNDKIWETLRHANRGMLEQAQMTTADAGLAGWLALAVSYNQHIANPTQLPQAIEQWKLQYPSHSASLLLPTELKNVASFQQTQLHGVALLLPLSGEAQVLGNIIKRGFDDARGAESELSVQTFDTDSDEVGNLIATAKLQGAQTIIGPLLKNRVDTMLASPEIQNVNILALNATPNARAIAQVCYYGLSPEAEARAAADRLLRDGATYALVVAPQDDFGQRASDAFAQRWRQLTNKDTDIRYYNQPIESVASIQNSGAAAGTAIYALGTADQLSEFKQGLDNSPLANQFTIYTSSRSNSPNNGPDFRLTMEGVKFSEIPLLAETESDLYRKVNNLADSDFSMMRLYAMGSDAWSVANKFNEFRQIPGYKVHGLTGVLSAGPNCNIEREMTWLQYQSGSVVLAR